MWSEAGCKSEGSRRRGAARGLGRQEERLGKDERSIEAALRGFLGIEEKGIYGGGGGRPSLYGLLRARLMSSLAEKK